jgi:hypothetical protein
MEFLSQPVPMWLFLAPFVILVIVLAAVVLSIKLPDDRSADRNNRQV